MQKIKLLEQLKQRELSDPGLPFKDSATNLVFGEGSPDAKLLFLGEAPGKNEDLTGKPFIGSAGKVLDKLLESINLNRNDVFITSVLHYRPPKNRDPKPEEIKLFEKYIDELIEIINPKVIATLGRFSLNKFLPDVKISQVHGKPAEINWKGHQLTIVPLYHPAVVLYGSKLKETLFEDFKMIKTVLKKT